MAWRVPRFGVRHSLRDLGAAAVSEQNAIATGDYEAFMFDERREVMSFATAETDHYVQVNMGADYATDNVDRIVVPVGHNFNGYDFRIRQSTLSDMSSPDQLLLEEPHSGTGQIDEDLDMASTKRFIRIDWITDNFAPDIPELWLTKTLAPGESAAVPWGDQRVYNVETFITPSGDRGDLQLGASQRVFELEYPYIDVAADIAMLDQLVDDVGMELAFLFDPPFDDESVLICRMARPPERRFVHQVPAGGSKAYTYRFSIIEQLV